MEVLNRHLGKLIRQHPFCILSDPFTKFTPLVNDVLGSSFMKIRVASFREGWFINKSLEVLLWCPYDAIILRQDRTRAGWARQGGFWPPETAKSAENYCKDAAVSCLACIGAQWPHRSSRFVLFFGREGDLEEMERICVWHFREMDGWCILRVNVDQ